MHRRYASDEGLRSCPIHAACAKDADEITLNSVCTAFDFGRHTRLKTALFLIAETRREKLHVLHLQSTGILEG
jgi:hypothetical protein